MEQILQQIAEVLCTVYAPSDACMYAIRRMGVTGIRINYKDRKKVLNDNDKSEITTLLVALMALDVDPSNQMYFYYRQVLYQDMHEILSD